MGEPAAVQNAQANNGQAPNVAARRRPAYPEEESAFLRAAGTYSDAARLH